MSDAVNVCVCVCLCWPGISSNARWSSFITIMLGQVDTVKKSIYEFAKKVRSGSLKGSTGKALTNIVCVGIGGSFLGMCCLCVCMC